METTTTLDAISRMDEDALELITNAVRARRDVLNMRAAAELLGSIQVGSKVRVRDNVRPMYLQGLTATVTAVTPYEVKLTFDDAYTAGRYARGCRCKLHQVEVVA